MSDHPVEHPTYMHDIRFMFTERDMNCMTAKNIDLRTYDGVKQNGLKIYPLVKDGVMPPEDQDRRWSAEWVQTFYNWIRDKYPRGVASQVTAMMSMSVSATRVRRDIATYDPAGPEMAKLVKAFKGMMARDPDHPQSYFTLAGMHWLPGPGTWCEHHGDRYNPWHRAYVHAFEDAMRSVEGCEDVTLPYWDITTGALPEALNQAPFNTYTMPIDVQDLSGNVTFAKGSKMSRYDDATITKRLSQFDVNGDITSALSWSHWEKFNGWGEDTDGNAIRGGIIAAHDGGHVSCGDSYTQTIGNQDIAAFDPLFWFFHCNWDRLWWKWQQLYTATTVEDFKTTLIGNADWLTDPIINTLQPFETSCDKMIDLSAMDTDYEHPAGEVVPKAEPMVFAAMDAVAGFQMPAERLVVRLSGVDRLQIPGSFVVGLLADGEQIRAQPVFQPSTPQGCSNCQKSALVNFTFNVTRDEIDGKRLTVNIEHGGDKSGPEMLEAVGNPTLDVHLVAQR